MSAKDPTLAEGQPGHLMGAKALVTGAGTRVGRAIAEHLGAEGVTVAVHYFSNREGADDCVRAIRTAGGRGLPMQADLRDRDESRRLVDRAVEELGGLDLVVASAAGFEATPLECLDDASWDRQLVLNLGSPAALALRAVPFLRARHGSIVLVTCSSVLCPFPGYLPYVVSKAGLWQLMRALSLELAPEVRVNAVAPGSVAPPVDMRPDQLARLAQGIPLGLSGTEHDVAKAVVFLAKSPFITGQQIVVDGGHSVGAGRAG